MSDHSLYEGAHANREEQASGIALGRITQVFPEERLCAVKTFMGKGSLNDQHIPKCQWINLDSNPDGDEVSSIPRKDSMGLVFFVDGEPFIFGFWKALDSKGRAITGNETTRISEGDKIIASVGGNSIVLKASGLIEITGKETLKTIYFPKDSVLADFCRNYRMSLDGGTITWLNTDSTLNTTLHRAEYRADILRTMIVVEERGTVDTTTIKRTLIGPGIPGLDGVKLPIYEHIVNIDGETTFNVNPLGVPDVGFRANVKPTGEFSINTGILPNFVMKVDATGELTLTVNNLTTLNVSAEGAVSVKGPLASIEMGATGDITAKNPGITITASVAGELKVDALTKITLSAKAGIDVSVLGPANIKAVGPMKLSGATMELDGTAGGGATDNVLTWPTTLSPFTGAPLVPFSTTVKVSK